MTDLRKLMHLMDLKYDDGIWGWGIEEPSIWNFNDDEVIIEGLKSNKYFKEIYFGIKNFTISFTIPKEYQYIYYNLKNQGE